MPKILATLLLSLAFTSPVLALDDVPGWQSLRWGMTEIEARRSLESTGYRVVPPTKGKGEDRWSGPNQEGGYIPFKTNLNIAGDGYEVILLFHDSTRRLGGVTLEGRSPGQFLEEQHARMLKLLTEKYGVPQSTGVTMRWTFKTTTIKLLSLPTLSLLHVYYEASTPPPKRDDKSKI
jgi:hypothetical protein